MDFQGSQFLIDVYNNIDLFLLVFVRLIGMFIIIPVLAGQNIPTSAKVALALGIAFIAMSNGNIPPPVYEQTVIGFFIVVLKEFLVGFIIGFIVYIFFAVFYFVGQLIDYQIGFSMVSVYDPVTQIQAPITGNLYYFIISIFFIQSGAFHNVIFALFKSYDVIGIGQGNIIGNDQLITYMMKMMVEFFTLGVKIALPIMGTIIVVDVALGVLVKAAPQMNIFVVGMPIKLFIGLVALWLVMPLLIDVYTVVMELIYKYITNIIKGMSP